MLAGMSVEAQPFPEFIRELPAADLPFAGLRGWLTAGDGGQAMFVEADGEVALTPHSHGCQWGVVIDGEIELTIGDHTRRYRRGDTYFIPAGVVHGGRIFPGFRALDFFAERDRHRALR
jgi:mannose-6-phosphate isomerase-like protein (cupin superfamily)